MTLRTMPDLGDDRFYATTDPTALWRELVDADAVVWTGPDSGHNGFWSVFSHRACAEVLAGDAPFTSEYGMFIGFDRQNPDSGGGRMIVVSEGSGTDDCARPSTPTSRAPCPARWRPWSRRSCGTSSAGHARRR
ncbi:hypothetical protein ACFQYP_12415 [Nonomuraea antimicrobica]